MYKIRLHKDGFDPDGATQNKNVIDLAEAIRVKTGLSVMRRDKDDEEPSGYINAHGDEIEVVFYDQEDIDDIKQREPDVKIKASNKPKEKDIEWALTQTQA